MDIKTIIPEIAARINPLIEGVQKGIRIRKPNKAPTGSAIPERKESQNAFFLFPVA